MYHFLPNKGSGLGGFILLKGLVYRSQLLLLLDSWLSKIKIIRIGARI